MATTTFTVVPLGTYAAGIHPFGPSAVPMGATILTARLDRTQLLSPTLTINWGLELSQDAGATWLPWGAAGTVGGALVNPRTGLPITESSFRVELPSPADANFMVRGSVANNELATTMVNLDVS